MDVVARFRHSPNAFRLAAGKVLFREGESAEVMYVLLEGTVEVIVGDTLVESAQAGTVLGEMAVIDRSPRSATAVAKTPCRLVSMTATQFDLLVHETPEFARLVMQVLSGRLRRMNQRLLEAFTELSVR